MVEVRRGEIWWAQLPEPQGSEPGFRRPVLILQADSFNQSQIRTVIGMSLTTNLSLAEAPGNVLLPGRHTGLPKDSVATVTQVFAMDRRVLLNWVGALPNHLLRRIEDGLRLVLDL